MRTGIILLNIDVVNGGFVRELRVVLDLANVVVCWLPRDLHRGIFLAGVAEAALRFVRFFMDGKFIYSMYSVGVDRPVRGLAWRYLLCLLV